MRARAAGASAKPWCSWTKTRARGTGPRPAPRRPAALPLLLLALVSCSPEPRWIAVATGGRGLTLFDGQVLFTNAWFLAAQPPALESTGDGSAMLIGAEVGTHSGAIGWLRRADGAPLVQQRLGGPVRGLSLDREGRRGVVLEGGAAGGAPAPRAGP